MTKYLVLFNVKKFVGFVRYIFSAIIVTSLNLKILKKFLSNTYQSKPLESRQQRQVALVPRQHFPGPTVVGGQPSPLGMGQTAEYLEPDFQRQPVDVVNGWHRPFIGMSK
jgi:hypothetical protein